MSENVVDRELSKLEKETVRPRLTLTTADGREYTTSEWCYTNGVMLIGDEQYAKIGGETHPVVLFPAHIVSLQRLPLRSAP